MKYRKIMCPEPTEIVYRIVNWMNGEAYESSDVASLLRKIAENPTDKWTWERRNFERT